MNSQLANAQRPPDALTDTNAQRQPQPTRSANGEAADAPRQPNLIYSYIFWTYERGSFHYDVMVTLILVFLFVAPHFIDFHDRPIPEVPARSSEILVRDAGFEGARHRFVYEIRAEDLGQSRSDAGLRTQIDEKVTNIAPDALVTEVKPVKDPRGRTVGYAATVLR